MYKLITVIIISSCLVQGLETGPICWGCFYIIDPKFDDEPFRDGEYKELEIKCPEGDRFKITEVFYGQKTGSTTCRTSRIYKGPIEGKDCSITKNVATELFQKACDDKVSTCVIRLKEDFMDQIDDWEDPCKSTSQF